MNIYTDGKKHKDNTFRIKAERDIEVKKLRANGWTVKVGKFSYDFDDVYWYKAIK